MATTPPLRLRRRTLLSIFCATLASTALFSAPAQANDEWPTRPIKVVVPCTPGGATDTVTRIVMKKLSNRLGQTIIVENRPGANGGVGSAAAAKADPDGYTFLSILPAFTINPHLYKLSFSPESFTAVVQMADLPLFLFVNNDLPVTSLRTDRLRTGQS